MGMMLVRRRLQTASKAVKRTEKVEEPVVKAPEESEARSTKKTTKKNNA